MEQAGARERAARVAQVAQVRARTAPAQMSCSKRTMHVCGCPFMCFFRLLSEENLAAVHVVPAPRRWSQWPEKLIVSSR